MKGIIKRSVKGVWRWTAPVRRPLVRRVEAFLVRCCNRPHHCHVSEETGALMEHLVREVVRLQRQIDALQDTVDALAESPRGLTVIHAAENERIASRTAAG